MAIFQPTNIIPSSFTQGTVDVNQNMEISWQVNGNSAMTAFQIDFYLNDYASTPVYSTGKLPKENEEQSKYNLPFYGTDRFGRPQFFTYNAGKTWAQASMLETNPFTNGNNYKFKITQFYNESGVEKSVVQTSFASFITRDKPTLKLYNTASDYKTDKTDLINGGSLATSIGYFVADYEQKQGDPIRWIRWQIATANNGATGDILADTGDIYTPTLNFEFNGFFNGNQYAIRCTGESESGQACNMGWLYFNISFEENTYEGDFTAQCLHKENATLLEWVGVEVILPTVEGDYTLNNGSVALPADSTISWQQTKEGKVVPFANPWTVAWKKLMDNSWKMNFLYNVSIEEALNKEIDQLVFNPTGTMLLVGYWHNETYQFSVKGTELEFVGTLKDKNGNSVSGDILFIPNDKYVMVGSHVFTISGNSLIYNRTTDWGGLSIRAGSSAVCPKSNTQVTGSYLLYKSNLPFFINDNGSVSVGWESVVEMTLCVPEFSHNGKLLVTVGAVDFTGEGVGRLYTINEFYNNVDSNTGKEILHDGSRFTAQISDAKFSPDDKLLVLCGAYEGRASVFRVDDTELTFLYDLTIPDPFIKNYCYSLAFNATGDLLVLGARDGLLLYTVNGTEIKFQNSIDVQGLPECRISPNPNPNFFMVGLDKSVSPLPRLPDLVAYEISTKDLSKGTFLSINNVANITLSREGNPLILKMGGTQLASIAVPDDSDSVAVVLTPTTINAYFYTDNALLSQTQQAITYIQQPIASVQISGGDDGATVESVSVYQGGGDDILSLYEKPDFEPVWNDNSYDLYMTANFNGNIQGGTGNAEGDGFQVYRREVGSSVLTPIANVGALVTQIKDYGIRSRKAYEYLLGVYDSNQAFMGLVQATKPDVEPKQTATIATNFKNYSLLVCDYDEAKDEYHVRKQYLFALNLSSGSVGNNNSPTLNANFTQYPTRMPSTQNYASGTLQGLIGAIYTVPALIEQIGNYKWTAKPSTLDYFDSVDLEKELYDLSTAPYQLFLRDMKGRLRMVHTNGAISMTTNIKQKQQSISISFPWVEVGDASDVTIIQTPKDYGWNNDNQVLDVQLDVDIATGELSATYPFPYNSTKFYLTGVNKEMLTAKTPLEVTPAQFNLSDVAEKTTDGEVTATVIVNSEDN